MTELTCKPASGAAAHDERLASEADFGSPRSIDDQGGSNPRLFLCRYRPGITQALSRCVCGRFNICWIDRVCGNGQTVSQMIEQLNKGSFSYCRCGKPQFGG